MTDDVGSKEFRAKLFNDAADLVEGAPALSQGVFVTPKPIHYERASDEEDGTTEVRVNVGDNTLCFCTVGAIGYAHSQTLSGILLNIGNAWPVIEDLRKALGLTPRDSRVGAFGTADDKMNSLEAVYRWNDTPGRTKEEVVALLRKAATV